MSRPKIVKVPVTSQPVHVLFVTVEPVLAAIVSVILVLAEAKVAK
jgi:hypothetical protein